MAILNFLKDAVAIANKVGAGLTGVVVTLYTAWQYIEKIKRSKEFILLGFVRKAYLETEAKFKGMVDVSAQKLEFFKARFVYFYQERYKSDPIKDVLVWAAAQADALNPKVNVVK